MMAGHGPTTRPESCSLQHPSPLQLFVKAKKKINDIFVEIEDYVKDTVNYVNIIPNKKGIVTPEQVTEIGEYVGKVKGIRDMLARDQMKVVFLGRTSNGKSTVINAMLRDKILPSGIGHTTECFVQVEGSETGETFLVTEGSSDKQNVKSVGQLAHALCEERLGESSLVRISWPKDKCLLLRDDVVFVDVPGLDISLNLDERIDKHCLDADVFVLVANAESTLTITEKNVFHKVSTRLSKPNIFILINRWDASASEPEFLTKVRTQHLERTVDFLVKELKVCTREQAMERIFFISAKEALQGRMQEQKGLPVHTGAIADGFPNRYFEFQDFERKFEECISKSAVKTKFEQHSQRGKHIANNIKSAMELIHETAQRLRNEKAVSKQEMWEKLDFTEKQLQLLTHEMKDKIHQMVEDVEQRVSKALSEEICQLSVLVYEFNAQFDTDPLALKEYKQELNAHVESKLGSNLRARLSTALAMNIESSQREMTERMSALLPPDKKQVSLNLLSRREQFEILDQLICDNLFADFQEDLEFNISLGIEALIAIFTQTPQTPSNEEFGAYVRHIKNWAPVFNMALAFHNKNSQTLQRLIAIGGTQYALLYTCARMAWTNKAKEREFKRQYVDHATRKLRLLVALTSANCRRQVQQELLSTFARLCHLVDEATGEMDSEIKQLEQETRALEESAGSAKVLRNKASYLEKELELFEEAYLRNRD